MCNISAELYLLTSCYQLHSIGFLILDIEYANWNNNIL